MDQPLADIGIISAYRFASDGSATKLDVANLDAELADPHGWLTGSPLDHCIPSRSVKV